MVPMPKHMVFGPSPSLRLKEAELYTTSAQPRVASLFSQHIGFAQHHHHLKGFQLLRCGPKTGTVPLFVLSPAYHRSISTA